MSESSLHFNFDEYDQQIAEALAENEQAMRPIIKRPGAIGSVMLKSSFEPVEQPEAT